MGISAREEQRREMAAIGLETMEGLVLETVLSKLGHRDTASVACVSTRLRAFVSDDGIWRRFCARDFGLSSPIRPDGEPCSSFKLAYELWFKSFGMYPLPLVRRVKECWEAIKGWLAINFPEAKETLRKGASEAEIKQVEDTLGVNFPLATRVLYRFCDGQETMAHNVSEHRRLAPLGIIGGYKFYDHVVNVHLLSLSQIVVETREYARQLGLSVKSKRIIVATSYFYQKWFFLDCANGQLHVSTKNVTIDGETMPCVPENLIKPRIDAHCDVPQDAFLLWLEEHGRRLQSGILRTREFGNYRSISLFPEKHPSCSVALTNGVKVRASAVFVPEMSEIDGGEEKYYYAYSIRMSLPEGCMLDGVYFQSCQLLSRHWIIKSKDVVVLDVHGEAVIGKHPCLFPNEDEFIYESCTPLPDAPGSIEGSFRFVPGRLRRPEGRDFAVKVAKFNLEAPQYVF